MKALFRIARAGRHPPDWKLALKARAEARQAWMDNKIRDAAAGDWGAYKATVKKGLTGWEGKLADAMGRDKDPHQEIHEHLSKVYGEEQPKVPTFPYHDSEVVEVPDFTSEELHVALRKGKKGVSVGPDKVSHELLLSIADTPEGEFRILEWFNNLLHGHEPLPRSWSRASMVIIPKVQVFSRRNTSDRYVLVLRPASFSLVCYLPEHRRPLPTRDLLKVWARGVKLLTTSSVSQDSCNWNRNGDAGSSSLNSTWKKPSTP